VERTGGHSGGMTAPRCRLEASGQEGASGHEQVERERERQSMFGHVHKVGNYALFNRSRERLLILSLGPSPFPLLFLLGPGVSGSFLRKENPSLRHIH
jgi:hypothetical protein